MALIELRGQRLVDSLKMVSDEGHSLTELSK